MSCCVERRFSLGFNSGAARKKDLVVNEHLSLPDHRKCGQSRRLAQVEMWRTAIQTASSLLEQHKDSKLHLVSPHKTQILKPLKIDMNVGVITPC